VIDISLVHEIFAGEVVTSSYFKGSSRPLNMPFPRGEMEVCFVCHKKATYKFTIIQIFKKLLGKYFYLSMLELHNS
jgi:hypothetical protein